MLRISFRSFPLVITFGVAATCSLISGCAKSPQSIFPEAGVRDAGTDAGDRYSGNLDREIPLVTDALNPPVLVDLDGAAADSGSEADFGGPVLLVGSAAETRLTSSGCDGWSRAAPGAGAGDTGAGGANWSKIILEGTLQAVAVDGQGRVALASRHQAEVDFGSGPIAIPPGSWCLVLSSFAASGTHRWSRSITTSGVQLSAWSDGGLAILLNDTVASVASDGSVRWVRFLDPQFPSEGLSLTAQTDGSVWVVTRSGPIFPDPAAWQSLVRLSATGEPLARFTFRDDDRGSFVSLSAAGDIFVVHNIDTNHQDFSLTKVGPDGQPIWFKTFSTVTHEKCIAAAATNDGGVVISGWSAGAFDLGGGPLSPGAPSISFAGRFDAQGRHVASHAFGSDWYATNLVALPSGAVLVANDFQGSLNLDGTTVHTGAAGDKDFLVVELGPTLHVTRFWHYGNGGGSQHLSGIAADPSGAMLLTGSFEGKLDLGSGVLRAFPWSNSFLARVQP